jgi:hypothetical protein
MNKLKKIVISCIIVLVVILLFAGMDFFTHLLKDTWSVPDYYFKDKIPFGFLWGIAGLFIASKFNNVWIKTLAFSGIIAVALQVRYFIEGYDLSFVFIFLFLHFAYLYFFSFFMFKFFDKYLMFSNKSLLK